MSKVEQAVSVFKQGFSCSQAILSVYGAGLGVDPEPLLKISSGFGAGMGRMGEVCGVLTGAFMVIGLNYGRSRLEDNAGKEKTQQMIQEMVKRFKARNRAILCRELLGCDLGTPEGIKTALEKNLIGRLCPKFVQDAGEILEGLL